MPKIISTKENFLKVINSKSSNFTLDSLKLFVGWMGDEPKQYQTLEDITEESKEAFFLSKLLGLKCFCDEDVILSFNNMKWVIKKLKLHLIEVKDFTIKSPNTINPKFNWLSGNIYHVYGDKNNKIQFVHIETFDGPIGGVPHGFICSNKFIKTIEYNYRKVKNYRKEPWQ